MFKDILWSQTTIIFACQSVLKAYPLSYFLKLDNLTLPDFPMHIDHMISLYDGRFGYLEIVKPRYFFLNFLYFAGKVFGRLFLC